MRRTVQPHAISHKLRSILVGGRQIHVESSRRALYGKRAHHVVRLESLYAHDGDFKGLRQLERIRNRRRKVFRHLLPLRLVRLIRLVAKSRPAWIHGKDDVRRRLPAENRQKSIGKSKKR